SPSLPYTTLFRSLATEPLVQRAPGLLAERVREPLALLGIGGQRVGLLIGESLQTVLDDAQQPIRTGERRHRAFRELAVADQQREHAQQRPFAQLRPAAAAHDLERLRDE